MALYTSRLSVFLAATGLPVALLVPQAPVEGQSRPPPPQAVETARDILPLAPNLLLPTEAALPRKLQAVEDYVRARSWGEAVELLQGLLDVPEDVFVPVKRAGPGGQPSIRPASIRAEASRLLKVLPRPGLTVYEFTYGPRARDLLAAAKDDPVRLAEIARRFLHTQAGAEAAARLGTLHLDRGRCALAAGCFERALESAASESADPLLLFQAALAYQRSGNLARAEQYGRRLADEAPDGLRIGDHDISRDDLARAWRSPVAGSAGPQSGDWPLFGGDAGRSAVAREVSLAREPLWQTATLEDGPALVWVEDALRQQAGASPPALPAFFPIAVHGQVISRTGRGLAARDLATGDLLWESVSELGLETLTRDPATHAHVASWAANYLSGSPQALLENSVLGSFSSDGERVYAVEDLPFPPYPPSYALFVARHGQGWNLPGAPEMTAAVFHNRLLALDLVSGKVLWEVGGSGAEGRFLQNGLFLGPPLPVDGCLYVPFEKNSTLHLLSLRPADGKLLGHPRLAILKTRIVLDGGRRLHALHLAFADGLIVCPTGAGGVVAFDIVADRLAWARAYREEPRPALPEDLGLMRGRGRWLRPSYPQSPPNLTSEWKKSAPVIHDGKVFIASPDANDLRCLNLGDGSLLWTVGRSDSGLAGDLFLAGACEGKVLVVGQKGVVALDAATGKRLWTCETQTPLGRGAVAGSHYLLPVRGGDGKPSVLLSIDLETGSVVERAVLPAGAALGNLVIARGAVLAQSATGLAAYGCRPGNKQP
jgi:outer membrane protein assembly factor BamB